MTNRSVNRKIFLYRQGQELLDLLREKGTQPYNHVQNGFVFRLPLDEKAKGNRDAGTWLLGTMNDTEKPNYHMRFPDAYGLVLNVLAYYDAGDKFDARILVLTRIFDGYAHFPLGLPDKRQDKGNAHTDTYKANFYLQGPSEYLRDRQTPAGILEEAAQRAIVLSGELLRVLSSDEMTTLARAMNLPGILTSSAGNGGGDLQVLLFGSNEGMNTKIQEFLKNGEIGSELKAAITAIKNDKGLLAALQSVPPLEEYQRSGILQI